MEEKAPPPLRVARFMGHFYHNLDDRGRINLPAKFREKLGDSVVITKGRLRCLMGYAMDEWERISTGLDDLSVANDDDLNALELIYANASDEEIDKQGRILIPAHLRQYAAIRDSVVIEGLNRRFAIWDRETWLNRQTALDEDSPEIIRHVGQHNVIL